MLCDPVSHYPDQIDEFIFFQDNSLDNIDIIKTYDNLIAQGKYNEANTYINQQEGIYGYFADFFNAIENRIFNVQSYLLTKTKINPFVFSDEEPSSVTQDTIWI